MTDDVQAKRGLRALVILEWVLWIGSFLAEELLEGSLPEELRSSLSTPEPWTIGEVFSATVALPLMTIGSAGLFFFKSWGPRCFAAGVVSFGVALPFFPPALGTSVGAAINWVSTLVGGLVLGGIFLGGFRKIFRERSS